MKLLYIADNRCRPNFGCRGTSIALSELLSQRHEIVATITGRYTHEDPGSLFFVRGMPEWMYLLLKFIPAGIFKKFKKLWVSVFLRRKLSKLTDFISINPNKSINNLVKCIHVNPHLREFLPNPDAYDGIVINGEGSLIMSDPPRRDALVFMMLMQNAINQNKKIFLVNTMFSECPVSGIHQKSLEKLGEILTKCNLITTRDPLSREFILEKFPKLKVSYIPDALFTWNNKIQNLSQISDASSHLPFGQENDDDFLKFDFSSPYICISGSSLSAWDKEKAYEAYERLVKKIKLSLNHKVYLIQPCNGDSFLHQVADSTETPCLSVRIPILAAAKILSNAALYISGRFHPAIMASLGGTPCIFMGSNSHKTLSIQDVLDYDEVIEFGANPTDSEIDKIIDLAKIKLDQGAGLRNKIIQTVNELSSTASLINEMICTNE